MPVWRSPTLGRSTARWRSLAQRKVVLGLVATFAIVALMLASIGLYGVMSYAVANRRRELGIRMALGARRAEVMRQVLGEGLTMMAVGLVIGLAGVAAAGRLLASELYQVPTVDPMAIAVTAVAVAVVAVLASLIPALRAARVDPITALAAIERARNAGIAGLFISADDRGQVG